MGRKIFGSSQSKDKDFRMWRLKSTHMMSLWDASPRSARWIIIHRIPFCSRLAGIPHYFAVDVQIWTRTDKWRKQFQGWGAGQSGTERQWSPTTTAEVRTKARGAKCELAEAPRGGINVLVGRLVAGRAVGQIFPRYCYTGWLRLRTWHLSLMYTYSSWRYLNLSWMYFGVHFLFILHLAKLTLMSDYSWKKLK